MRGVIRCVTITIGCVLRGAMRGAFFAARRLRELPDCCIGDAARRRGGRILWKYATRRWRTHVVEGPDHDLARWHMTVNVVCSRDGDTGFFLDRNAGAVDAGEKACSLEFLRPRAKIYVVSSGKAAAFFDVQKNNRINSEAFLFCRGCGSARILSPPFRCVSFIFEF